MQRSKHIIFFTTLLSLSTVFGSEAAFGANTPRVSSTHFPVTHRRPVKNHRPKGIVRQYDVGSSWGVVPDDAGWHLVVVLKKKAPEDKSTSKGSTWFGWIGSWFGGGAKVTSNSGTEPEVFVVAETSNIGSGRAEYGISQNCINSMCAEPQQGRHKKDEIFYIVTIDGDLRILTQGELPSNHPVLGTLTFETSHAAKNYLKRIIFKLSQE